MAARRSGSSRCCASISCSNGSTYRPAVEEALYGSLAMRRFVGIDLGREPVPDETTVCRFRHLPEQIWAERRLTKRSGTAQSRLKIAKDTIVDATIIKCAVFHQKRREGARSRYGITQRRTTSGISHEGTFGVDSRSKLIHAVVTTPANAADSTVLPDLSHGESDPGMGDQAYHGQRAANPTARGEGPGFSQQPYRHRGVVDQVERAKKPHQSRVRARPNMQSGNQAGVRLAKVRYRGLKKNTHLPDGDLGAEQFVHGAPPAIALPTG